MFHHLLTETRQRWGMAHFVYIMSSRPGGTIYIGRSSNLRARVEQHRSGSIPGHTCKYKIKTLVWLEVHKAFSASLLRERRIKRWRREWKDVMIAEVNPEWRDITIDIPD